MASTLKQMFAPTLLGDRYRTGRELGTGGMATVFLATDIKYGRQVAVKVLRRDLARSLAVDRFLREIQIAAQFLHPHILGLIDSGEVDGVPFYVMPYVEGESLRAWTAREGPLAIDLVARIFRQVASALSYAHARGIVHRDIKPENVLVSTESLESQSAHALVSDFGVAKALEQAQAHVTRDVPASPSDSATTMLTSVGTVIGTPAYMAPEQAAGDTRVDHRADLYALGGLVYELLAGRQVFHGDTPAEVIASHMARAPEPIARLRPAVPDSLERVVMRCLEKRPIDRFQDADDLLRALDEAAAVGAAGVARAAATVERSFVLSEEVCRRFDRSTLDPRIIGDQVSWLDNRRTSPVLVCFIHGTGLDQYQAERHLRELSYRAMAPTLYGFERHRRRRLALPFEQHLVVLWSLIEQARQESGATRIVIVGLSSGADVALRMIAMRPEPAVGGSAGVPAPAIHGLVGLGANLSLATCFATQLFAELVGENPDRLLDVLKRMGSELTSLDDWLNVHGYFVEAIRKFHFDVAVVRRFAKDIIAPFAATASLPASQSPLVEWYRAATERIPNVRLVFEDTETCNSLLGQIRLAQLDRPILGPRYRPETIVVEPQKTHFDLFAPDVVCRHLEAVLAD